MTRNPTHEMSLYRFEKTDSDPADLDTAPSEPEKTQIVERAPVRYKPSGSEYIDSSTGDKIQRSSEIRCRPDILEVVKEGDYVKLYPIGRKSVVMQDVIVSSIEVVQSVRSSRPTGVTLSVESA